MVSPHAAPAGPREVWFRRALLALAAIAGLGALAYFGLAVWAENEFTQPESIVAVQSMALSRDGSLYYGLKDYPYTVCAYMPIFYLLDAGLIRLGVSALLAGRIIGVAALLAILVLIRRLAMLYTGDRHCAWTATLLSASTSLLLGWGTVGQVDTLAVCFSLAAFDCYSRFALKGQASLVPAMALALAALFTKQTMIAAPMAIFGLLWFQHKRKALLFAAVVAGGGGLAVLAINAALDGRFLANTVLANLNPFSLEKLSRQLNHFSLAAGALALIAAAGLRAALTTPARALYVYLGLALGVFALTASKVGSDLNYQVEATILLILAVSAALHSLGFFQALFAGRGWVTLLQIPLALHLAYNLRLSGGLLLERILKEAAFRHQLAELAPYVSDGGRVLSAEMNGVLRLRGRLEVEPLIYTLLVRAGRVDPGRLSRDLRGGRVFSTIVLYQDVRRPGNPGPEFPTLPEDQLREIRESYTLAAHIPGPYLDGLYVYRPAQRGAL